MTRYELLERIGHGGMAEIFKGKAVAAGGFEKPVAIKRILPHLSQDERFVKLLIDEANLLSQLRHRNIVQIFDMGLGEDGQYFLVMEYVDGTDVGALYEQLEAKRKRLPVDLALHIAAEVCEALHHAHLACGPEGTSLGLVHRDVSPANILVSVNGEVKLTDFGIAKQKDEMTGHGSVRGKFAYISPEQAANKHVDARSDVYSVGIVLYELLLGHRLFSGLPDFDALKAVRAGDVTRPSQIDGQFDPELEKILMKALAPDPAARPESAGEFGASLRGYRYSMPTLGADPGKELARLLSRVERAAQGSSFPDHEPTVLRIQTAAGFTSSGFELAGSSSSAPSFLSDLEFEDDETTAARPMPEQLSALMEDSDTGARMATQRVERSDTRAQASPTVPNPIVSHEGRLHTPLGAGQTPTTDPFSLGVAQGVKPTGPGFVGASVERAATPTVRELFYGGELLDDSATGVRPPSVNPAASSDRLEPQPDPRLKRRNSMLLLLAVIVVAVGSFFVASRLLAKDDKGAAVPVDAGIPDALVVPDANAPAAKPPPKRKRTRRKRPRRKSRRKATPSKDSSSSK